MSPKILDVIEGQGFDCPYDIAEALDRSLGGHHTRSNGKSTVSRIVGHLRLRRNLYLRIRSPKAQVANLLSWAAYVDPTLEVLQSLVEVPRVADQGDIAEALALAYCHGLEKVLHRSGLLRRYSRTKQSQAVIQGRIDFPRLVRHGGATANTPCEVWRRVTDTPLNRLLAAALHHIQCTATLRRACHKKLEPLLCQMEGVPRTVSSRILRGQERLSRLEAGFEATAQLARWLVLGGGTNQGASQSGMGFILNLEALFERAVIRAFEDTGLATQSQKRLVYQRDHGGEAAFMADLYCPNFAGEPLVVDAKFKTTISASNLQQMVTYCAMTGASRAVLVVPDGCGKSTGRFTVPTVWKPVEVWIVELETNGQTVEEWKRKGGEMIDQISSLLTADT